jgi:putative hydrolase of the HAD superfamily
VQKVRALFWDIGGVLLTNAWDHEERDVAIRHFALDKVAFEMRHRECVAAFEEGQLSLDEYLSRTVFYIQRAFTREEFTHYIFSLSKPKPEILEIARTLAHKYPMCTINNESRELNQHRIAAFSLREIFDTFVTSCFVGIRKPDARIYRLALDLRQCEPAECCFIDDRQVNVDAAKALGMNTVLMQDSDQLRNDLNALGVS